MKDKDFCSHDKSIDGENDDDFDMNSKENIASLDPHLSEDEVDEAELVKTCKHFHIGASYYKVCIRQRNDTLFTCEGSDYASKLTRVFGTMNCSGCPALHHCSRGRSMEGNIK